MAILEGRVPPANPSTTSRRVVVKLADAAPPAAQLRGDAGARILSELRRAAPGAEFRPYFAEAGLRAAARPPFDRYLVVEAADGATAERLARALRGLGLVADAYVEAGPTPPPAVNPTDDPRSPEQGYLAAAPAGIDARHAWTLTDGAGIGFVDLEQGWTLDHEDLAGAKITLISGLNQAFHGHGTAVLGQVAGVDNARGVIGIAPGARTRVVSQHRDASTYSTAAAILSAVQTMSAGDVLLLEAQVSVSGGPFLPVEIETAVFDAIRHAVDQGVVVVEAAGNGSQDLDTYADASGRRVLNRSSGDFRDSGAIMVGAASAAAPHVRLGFSNHGSRVDCYGWGEAVVTTGDGWQGTSTTGYTSSFGGTSSASPIVAGAAVLLQSWRRARFAMPYAPGELRALLSAPVGNTPSANPATDRIGVMPNLRAILDAEGRVPDELRVTNERYLSLVLILIGLIDDSPGWIWVPGKGPVPVDPGWGRLGAAIAGPKRDALAALAVHEISERMADGPARSRLAAAAADALREAAGRLGAR